MTSHLEVTIVHSSDLHLGTDDSFSEKDRLAVLPKVLAAASESNADVVVLAGDSFDNHRQPIELLERAAQMLSEYRKPVVILPGNHDPLTPDSVYRRAGLGLDAAALRLVERTWKRFVKSGAKLDAAGKKRLAAINEELSSLGTKFGQNVLADESEWALFLDAGDLAVGNER